MSGICAKIGQDILRECDNKPVLGIEQRLVLINTEDLPATGITFDTTLPSSLITQLQLATGKTGYEVQGIKQIMNYTNSLEASEDSDNGVIQSLAGIRIYDPSETIRDEVNKFVAGAKVYAVLERKWKGTDNKHAFLFFGLKFGLELTELTDNSNENDGTIVMTLSTPSGFKEPYLPHIYRDTDYATSLTAFNNKFAA
jgi:hypothetical protein